MHIHLLHMLQVHVYIHATSRRTYTHTKYYMCIIYTHLQMMEVQLMVKNLRLRSLQKHLNLVVVVMMVGDPVMSCDHTAVM